MTDNPEAMLPSDNRGAVCIKAWTEYEPAENPRLTDAQRQRHAFFNGFEAAWNTRSTTDKDARIAVLEAALKEARDRIEGLHSQFDFAGCTCTFPSDDCCSYAATETDLAEIDQALKGQSNAD